MSFVLTLADEAYLPVGVGCCRLATVNRRPKIILFLPISAKAMLISRFQLVISYVYKIQRHLHINSENRRDCDSNPI